MRRLLAVFLAVLLSVATGCSDDGGGGGTTATDSGSSGSDAGSSGGGADSGGSSGGASSDAGSSSGGAGSDAGASSSGGGADAGPVAVLIQGEVNDLDEKLIEGATVTVLTDSNLTAKTDSKGVYSLNLPAGAKLELVVKKASFADSIVPIIPAAGGKRGATLLKPAQFDDIFTTAGLGKLEAGKGVLAIELDEDSATKGKTATIDLAHGGTLVFGKDGKPMKGDKTPAGGDSTIVFVNVAPGKAAVTTSCKPKDPIGKHTVAAGSLTIVDYDCM